MLPLVENSVPFALALVVYYVSLIGVFYFVISKSVMFSNSIFGSTNVTIPAIHNCTQSSMMVTFVFV
jgi:hypothetical protein